jgi:hypothetical protein
MSDIGSIFRLERLTKIRENFGDADGLFLVECHAEVTRRGDPGGEAFKVTVASPLQLAREISDGAVEFGRGYLFMLDYDEGAIVSSLQKMLDGSHESKWSELKSFVDRYFDWID